VAQRPHLLPLGRTDRPRSPRLLDTTGWSAPGVDSYPTGQDWAGRYLTPLADALGDAVRLDHQVIGIARRGRDRIVDAGRDTEPLSVHVRHRDGTESRLLARAVIDASVTWDTPSPLGGEGLPALGERAAAEKITYRVPDLGEDAVRARYAGRHTVIAGSGHSTLNAIVALAELARTTPGTRLTWVLRRGDVGLRAKTAVDAGLLEVVTGFRTAAVEPTTDGQLTLVSDTGARIDAVGEVIASTGFRPDLSWLSEIRLDLDPVLQAPTALAPLIDPNVHSCGTVYPHGVAELSHPEPGFYVVGMKSYGRAPTFLAMTGYEQVRSIAAALAGDHDAAARVELTLPDTGVCGGAGVFDESTNP